MYALVFNEKPKCCSDCFFYMKDINKCYYRRFETLSLDVTEQVPDWCQLRQVIYFSEYEWMRKELEKNIKKLNDIQKTTNVRLQ